MKTRCVLLLAGLLLPAHFAGAAPKAASHTVTTTIAGLPVTVQGDFVTVDAGNNDALSQNALRPFTALLKAYPHARRFSLSWYTPVLMSADGADILYDRRKHTVTLNYTWGGGDDPEHVGRVRFTRVREAVFAAILKVHPNGVPEKDAQSEKIADTHSNDASSWGGFQFLYLPRYGCHPHSSRERIER